MFYKIFSLGHSFPTRGSTIKKNLLALFFVTITLNCFGQNWKNYLDSASSFENSQPQKALSFYLVAIKLLEKDSAVSNTYATCLTSTAILYFRKREYEKAGQLYLEAKGIREIALGKEHPDYASSCNHLGRFYDNMRQYEKAEPLYLEARAIRAKILGKDHPDYATSCNNLAVLYYNMSQYEKAVPLFLEAKGIEEKVLGKDHPDYAISCKNLAGLYDNMGQYEKAEPLYLEAKAIEEKVLGKDHPDYASSCNNLAVLYENMGKYDKAELLYLEAKAIRENVFGKEHRIYANSCNNLAGLYDNLGQYEKAEPLYLEAKIIREKVLGKGHPDYATSCNNLAVLYVNMGQYGKAETLIVEAKAIREKVWGNQHPDYANSCNTLATFYENMGEYEKAEPLYIEAKAIREKVFGKEHSDYATSCNNLARLYFNMGQYEKVEPLYLEAKKIRENVLGKDLPSHPDYARSCNNLAVFYSQMGQYEKAEPLFLESKAIRERVLGKGHPDYASSCDNLAGLYNNMGQHKKAEPLYLEAVAIRAKALGKDHPDYATSSNNLATFYENIGQYEKATPVFLEVKSIRERVLGKDHPDYASSCNNLAALFDQMGQYKKAELLYLEAKAIREKVLGKEHPDYTGSCNNLARLYNMMGKYESAEPLYEEAFEMNYRLTKKVLNFTSEKEKVFYIKNIVGKNPELYSFSYSQKKADLAYNASFLSRHLIFSSSHQVRKAIKGSNDLNALSDYEKWLSLKKQLAAHFSRGGRREDVNQLEETAELLEKRLARTSSGFKKHLESSRWQEIQNSLENNEAAIELVEFNYYTGKRWTDSTYYTAILLRKDNPKPVMVYLFEKKQLDSLLLQTGNKTANDNVKTLYASRGLMADEISNISHSLYELVWQPLESELKGIKTIYYAPAGLLHRVAFAALPCNDTAVLSDNYHLVQLNSTASLIDQKDYQISSTDKIVLFGGIKYDADSTAQKKYSISYNTTKTTSRSLPPDLTRGGAWNFLPGTKKEADAIVKVAKTHNIPVSHFYDIQATEESIKGLDGEASPAVLHVATHGFFFPDPKEEKKRDLVRSLEPPNVFKQSDDPLFRSGLLFAGANAAWNHKAIEGREDGILTSYEISNMYLPNTKLVVLSACETGLGDIQGSEGVYGLQRAFKMAGAENLIMSLWKVPDEETAEFMKVLYQNLFMKQLIGDAFVGAQTVLKNKYRKEPYKWAAWVLVR